MLAAVMSSLSSVYNSSSTIFTIDIWQKFIRKQASEREKVIVGRIVVASLVIMGLLWMQLIDMGGGGRLFKYLQTIQMLLGAPVMAVFGVGILWPRANEVGGLAGLIVGIALGLSRFIAEYIHPTPACNEVDDRPGFASLNFMYFGIILFFATVAVIVVASLVSQPIPLEELAGLTWRTLYDKAPPKDEKRSDSPDQYEMVNQDENASMVPNKNSPKTVVVTTTLNGGHLSTIENGGQLFALHVNNTPLTTPKVAEDDVLYQSRKEKILLNFGTAALLFTLAFLWIWYR